MTDYSTNTLPGATGDLGALLPVIAPVASGFQIKASMTQKSFNSETDARLFLEQRGFVPTVRDGLMQNHDLPATIEIRRSWEMGLEQPVILIQHQPVIVRCLYAFS